MVALFLACLAFWSGADFLHQDDGAEYVRDCPVCSLERVTSCETPAASVAPTSPPMVLVWSVAVPLRVARAGRAAQARGRRRGPTA
jgi:hypothetical protein